MKRHGIDEYFIEGEGIIRPATVHRNRSSGRAVADDSGESSEDTERFFRFSRMFRLPGLCPTDESLIALGEAMEDSPAVLDHPSTPAGYTYLGQFIDHDITFDETGDIPNSQLSPEDIINGRTPSLDLDSVYGRGPQLESKPIYESDRIRLRVGSTSPTPFGGATFPLPNDLPRMGDSSGNSRAAIIGDPRNDENLAVAQTHLLFIKAHNKLVAQKELDGFSGSDLFEAARNDLLKHYQWIVLHDFLPRIIKKSVLDDVLANGRRFFTANAPDELTMPVEFSVAAYRLGHSMIRDDYEWNRVFRTGGVGNTATLANLFDFTGNGSMRGSESLPSNWVVDWRLLYDLSPTQTRPSDLNMIRLIDEKLAFTLKKLPGFPPGPMANLAVRNLIRGRLLRLPSGQSVADAIGETPLSKNEILSGPHFQVIEAHGLALQTPLWYYVLKEAKVQENGERLGLVGSRILAEVFVGLIENSQASILDGTGWVPTLPSRSPGQFEMADLVLFVDDINPLGE